MEQMVEMVIHGVLVEVEDMEKEVKEEMLGTLVEEAVEDMALVEDKVLLDLEEEALPIKMVDRVSVSFNIIFKTEKKNKREGILALSLISHYIHKGSVVISTIRILKRCKVKNSIVSAYSKAILCSII